MIPSTSLKSIPQNPWVTTTPSLSRIGTRKSKGESPDFYETQIWPKTATRVRWVPLVPLAWPSSTIERTVMKNITIVPATGGPYSDLAIAPGTTPRDVKKQIGLAENFVLTRGRGTEPIPDGENLYESVSDGSKLFATTDVQWGS
jgi:hypothetical protein